MRAFVSKNNVNSILVDFWPLYACMHEYGHALMHTHREERKEERGEGGQGGKREKSERKRKKGKEKKSPPK